MAAEWAAEAEHAQFFSLAFGGEEEWEGEAGRGLGGSVRTFIGMEGGGRKALAMISLEELGAELSGSWRWKD